MSDAVMKSSNSSFQIRQRCQRVPGLPTVSNTAGPVSPLQQMAVAQNSASLSCVRLLSSSPNVVASQEKKTHKTPGTQQIY